MPQAAGPVLAALLLAGILGKSANQQSTHSQKFATDSISFYDVVGENDFHVILFMH